MGTLEEFNLEKKKMRREDRLGEVDFHSLHKNGEESGNIQSDKKMSCQTVTT